MNERPVEDSGLRHAENPLLDAVDPQRSWTPGRIAVQVIGLLIGLAMLAWALSLAFDAQSAGSLEALRNAPPVKIATLLGLSVTGLALSGAMFWVVLLPLRRLKLIDVCIVNAMATALSVLPFKLGLLTRALIHHRRDGVRFRDLLAWLAGCGALAGSVLLPLGAASAWRGRLDWIWWAVALGGTALGAVAAVALGRLADRHAVLHRLSFGADAIVRHWTPVVAHAALRFADVGVLAARFMIAASIVGYGMSPDRAVLFATVYFFLSVVSPTGTIGLREMGVTGLGWAQREDQHALALIALVVSASELLCATTISLIGAPRIRPDRLLLGRGREGQRRSP